FTLIETHHDAARDFIAAHPALARARLRDPRGFTAAGGTALHLAAYMGYDKVAGWLIDAGADVNARDQNGLTPLVAAAINRKPATVQMLLRNQADPNIATKDGTTALMKAAGSGCAICVRALLEKGAKADALDDNRRGALHETIWLQDDKAAHEIIRRLLVAGANPAQRDKSGKTALDDARHMTFVTASIIEAEIASVAAERAEAAQKAAVAREIGKMKHGTGARLPAPGTARFRRPRP
ncbi:MAG TPA: ankyrin repeat domain-containing protein, partial [Patescibacteria group bacterium]|nr:ankyrin repeat domain-containing protein [Patescibacteria group bacterium]